MTPSDDDRTAATVSLSDTCRASAKHDLIDVTIYTIKPDIRGCHRQHRNTWGGRQLALLLLLLLIYSASVAGEETLHTYSYVHSHIKDEVKNKNLIK